MAPIIATYSSPSSGTESDDLETSSSYSSTVISEVSDDDLRPGIRTNYSAITGMACRVAGATNARELWDVLEKRKDLQRKMPEDRYNVDAFFHPQGTNKGTTNARYGYFLDQGLDKFDAQFFNISGKEAQAMDPQQRLLLEVVYEAVEDAGITLDELSGSRTGVFVGSFTNDYSVQAQRNLEHYPKYSITGLTNSILANRISFFFNLHGPSYQLDTACSSSLTCLHLANQSLQSGESDVAIVCGSAIHFDPYMYITMTDFGMLSTDGRCRAFDVDGSGYVRGEGVCVVVLKRVRDAETGGDTIKAIIRGSGINHDGLKEGLTMPNPKSQAALIRETYKAAGLSTSDTQYFEAHGTGTAAGDPRESNAIGSVFGPERSKPLYIGSLKTNLGHLEGASGIASIIKTSLMLQKGKIAPNLLFKNPNPQIDFERGKLKVVTEMIDWPATNGPRRASINSFGFGGSNAHIILDAYSPLRQPGIDSTVSNEGLKNRPFLLPLSSHSENAGRRHIANLMAYVEQRPETAVADLAYSHSVRRTLHPYRSFAIGQTLSSLMTDLASPKPVAAWTRQGAQWYAMGRQLINQCPLFRQTLEKCDRVLQRLPDAPRWSCVDELLKSAEESHIMESQFSQPLCTALQLSLVDLLRSWGIKASAVVGHSSGEVGAAYAAGILSFQNAITCAFYRGLYMSKGIGSASGAMMAVTMTESEAKAALEPFNGRIALAAINSSSSLTLSGDESAILELKATLDEQNIFARRLQVEQAFHSHHMFPLAPGFRQALSTLSTFQPRVGKIPMCSSVTGRPSGARAMDAEYWAANMTGVVRFSDALTGVLISEDEEPALDVLVEIGPHPALRGPSKQVMKGLGIELPYIGSLDRKVDAYESLLATAGQLFALGYDVDLAAVNAGHVVGPFGKQEQHQLGIALADLPTYAWDHQSYWSETRVAQEYRQRKARHGVLGALVQGHLRPIAHAIDGKIIFPGAGYLSMALEAITSDLEPNAVEEIIIRNVTIKAALSISESDTGTETMLDLVDLNGEEQTQSSHSWSRFTIYSFDDGKTTEHCTGLISAIVRDRAIVSTAESEGWESESSFADLQALTTRSQLPSKFYDRLYNVGLQYGDNFRLMRGPIESGPGFAIAPMVYRPKNVTTIPEDECILHPSFFDCTLHTLFAALETHLQRPLDDSYIPTSIQTVRVSGSLVRRKHNTEDQEFWVRADNERLSPRVSRSDIFIHDRDSNTQLVTLKGLEVTGLGIGDKSLDEDRNLFFRIHWQEAFSLQGLVDKKSPSSEIGDLLGIYAHQFPAAKLLHVTPGLLQTQRLLARVATPEDRRIQSFSILAADETISALNEQLDALLPGLRQEVDLANDEFDIVVLEERTEADPLSLVKGDGFVVTLTDIAEKGLQKRFSAGQWTVWQKSEVEREQPVKENLHLILSSQPSPGTLAIAAAIKTRNPGTQTSTLETVPKEATQIISLINLDEDLLYDASSDRPAQFDAVRTLLVSESLKIVWLLRGATQEPVCPAQALFTGLARAARSENEDLHLVTLDVSYSTDANAIGKFAVHVLDPSVAEDELRVSDNRLFIPRVITDDQLNRKLPNGPGRQPIQQAFTQDKVLALEVLRTPGQADSILYTDGHGLITDNLDDHEVEFRVSASAISDRDAAIVAGTLHDSHLGETAVGFVTRVGAHVDGSKIRVGDRIFAYSPQGGAHRSLLRLSEKLAFAIPGEISDTDAVALGHNLLIAHYALLDIAHLRADEQCLVLGGSSGLAQVAVQLVEAVGAHTLTAPTSKATKANVILRTDASTPFTHEFWDILAIGGRIIDLAATSAPWNAGALLPGYSYTAVDLAAASRQDDCLGPRLVQSVDQLFQKQTFSLPSPVRTFGYGEVDQALRHSRLNGVDGQLVLFERPGEQVAVAPPTYRGTQPLFQSHKTYLIVGGLGGIGRALSQWMFRRGARQFAFLSRSGARKAEAKETVNWLEHRKATVTVYSGDVTSEKDVRKCVHLIGDSLRGVIQAAMVLESGPLSEMTAGQWASVIRPKVYGAENLHHATKELPLDFFICFSSISAIIGFMAEANYSASNAYLDAFVRWRHAQGLPGFAMNVGVVADAGAIAEDAHLRAIIDRIGMDVLTEEELFYQIEEAINGQRVFSQQALEEWVGDRHHLLSGINTRRTDLFWSKKPLFRNLYAGRSQKSAVSGNSEEHQLSELLQQAGESDKMFPVLLDAFSDRIASSLAVSRSIVQAGVPLAAYGMDSLVAVEFRKWFSKEVGVNLALFDILGSKSTGDLVAKVCDLVVANDSSKGPGANDTQATSSESPQASTVAKTSELIPIVNSRPAQIPMSTFQRRLWFMHNLTADSASLNVSVSLIIDGTPKLSLLERVWQELGRRNESLRTAFFEGDDFAEQEIVENGLIPIEQADVSNTSDPEESLRSFAAALRQQPLDVDIGQLIRSALVKLGDSRYAWVLSIHHMAIDGGSKASLMEQISTLYNAIASGANLNTVTQPKLSYVDFTLWHEQRLQMSEIQDQLKWWRKTLAGAPAASKLLPFAQNDRPASSSRERDIVRGELNKQLFKRMKRICSRLEVTSFHFVTAALRAFLHRYTGENDLTILVVSGERPHTELDQVLGFFVNMIPLRSEMSGDETFDALVTQIKRQAVDALGRSQAPFDAIVEAMNIGWSPSHFPLGQIAVNYQTYAKAPTYPTVDFDIPEVRVEDMPTAFEMQLEITEDEQGGLKLRLDFDSFLYSKPDMERMFQNFSTFLTSVVQDYRQPIEEIEMVGNLELARLRALFWTEEISAGVDDGLSLWELFAKSARVYPGSTAITTSGGQSITYKDLLALAEKLAATLHNSGITAGDRVGILSCASIHTIAAMLALSRLSGTYVALDPDFAESRLVHMIQDSSSVIVLVDQPYEPRVVGIKEQTTARFMSLQTSDLNDEGLPPMEPHPDPYATYVTYTSGSTGAPKGVVITHENTRVMLDNYTRAHRLTNQDVVLSATSICFDISVAQIWAPLTTGATLALALYPVRKDPGELAQFMRKAGVTMGSYTPTQFALLIEHGDSYLRQCTALRAVNLIGEALPARLAKAIYDLGLPATVYNEYGPSEATSQVTSHPVPRSLKTESSVSIGRALPDSTLYIVNSRLRPVPVGVRGELCIGGGQLSPGYLGHPKKTQQAFVKNPFVQGQFRARGWTHLYRTGDQARHLEDGTVDFLGRIAGDKQVKLRGYRIDLAEIENQLDNHFSKDNAVFHARSVVLVREVSSPNGLTDDRQLVAFLIPGIPGEEQQLYQDSINSAHTYIAQSLNSYMLPSSYQVLGAFPSLISGKVDRAALARIDVEPLFPGAKNGKSEVTTANALSSQTLDTIITIFRSVLKLGSDREIKSTDTFFELGGQSVLALRLQGILKRKLKQDITLLQLFDNPSPAKLSALLDSRANPGQASVGKSTGDLNTIDWDREIHLPDDYQHRPASRTVSNENQKPTGILVLGADSFIGIFLVKALLTENPDATICVLGIGNSLDSAGVLQLFQDNQLLDATMTSEWLSSHVRPVPGLMVQPDFGLGQNEFRALAGQVQQIFHTGGHVSLLQTYSDLRQCNVESVSSMIRLAALGSSTSLHYISTWSAVHMQSWNTSTRKTGIVSNREVSLGSFVPPTSNASGYFKTRWVGEQLLETAAQRGFPTTIYRCSGHTAPLTSPIPTPRENFTLNLFLGMIRAGVVPDIASAGAGLEATVNLLPIDNQMDTVAQLATHPPTGLEIQRFHINNPVPLPWTQLPSVISQVREDGEAGTLVDIDTWTERMLEHAITEQERLEWSTFKEYLSLGHVMFALDETNTRAALESQSGSRLECPPVDAKYLQHLKLKQAQYS
ncbi:hypothetical protein N7509_007964 [Penicillium cosmopolitanum]|uniref:Carrier domain-containing protein n=1 Tax=Penicillium cosmopolitanum TaxID=1131564 RepID=A0A9W9W000_9EURO|nr:uncharacterized protein N7509_007964 [Penicillium cosmopolitanum]KAJ5392474.1 hypothetical protein N7509_007964 [Penicillium cosmopolitanum]